MIDALTSFGGLGVLAVFATILLRFTLSFVKDLMEQLKALSAMIGNHLVHLVEAQQLQNEQTREMLAELKTFGTVFRGHMVDFEKHRNKSEEGAPDE